MLGGLGWDLGGLDLGRGEGAALVAAEGRGEVRGEGKSYRFPKHVDIHRHVVYRSKKEQRCILGFCKFADAAALVAILDGPIIDH